MQHINLYYAVRKFIPRSLQIRLRRHVVRRKKEKCNLNSDDISIDFKPQVNENLKEAE